MSYEDDVDRAMGLLAEIGHSVAADETLGKLVLEPPQELGVEALADSQAAIRMLARTLPLKEWEVAGELLRRIEARFDREGVRIPSPHRVSLLAPPARESSRHCRVEN